MAKPKKYYAVARGRNPGIYSAWFGAAGAEIQVRGFAGARYKGFPSITEARQWMESLKNSEPISASSKKKRSRITPDPQGIVPGDIIIYTDGGCRGNPGPGGYGAVIIDGRKRVELSQGFRLTTNNRMELMACMAALEVLKKPSNIALHSDSRYVVNGIERGWARKWRANNWMRTKKDPAENGSYGDGGRDCCRGRGMRQEAFLR